MERISYVREKIVQHARAFAHYVVTHKEKIAASVLVVVFIFTTFYALTLRQPAQFPHKYTFTVEEGTGLSAVADRLKAEGLIKSPFFFKVVTVLAGQQSHLQAGDYYFHDPINTFGIIGRIASGDYGLTPVSVFVPEGSTIFDVGRIFGEKFTTFDEEAFVARALKEEAEGYLFPDTYLFLPNVNEKKVFEVMRENFDTRIASVTPQIEEFGITLEDAIIMASLIEKESANDFEERRTISGILWNRMDIGMALQVDAVFPYINGKNTFELTTDDLAVESPYNTYTNVGLPIGPIANPGLDSIIAAVDPISSDYFFYLHDRSGNVHYSVTFEGHKANKARYLR